MSASTSRGSASIAWSPIGRCASWRSFEARAPLGALVEQAGADRALERADLLENVARVRAGVVGLEHHVADLAVGLVVLRADIDLALGEHLVEPAEHARQVALHLDEARAAGALRQLNLPEVDRADGPADVGQIDQLARDLGADALLRLLGRAADMRRQDDVVEPLQRRAERLGVPARLDPGDVERPPAQMAFL